MNITHVVENLNRGGLERMVIELAKRQQERGHRCQIVCIFAEGSLAHELTALGIAVNACDKRSGFDWRALRRARALIRAHATDVMHTHNAVAHYQATLATCGLHIARVINTRHSMARNVAGHRKWRRRREWLYRRAVTFTDTVALVCQAARDEAVARKLVPARKASVVPNGIPVDRFHPARREAHERLASLCGVAAHALLVGTVGRLNWAKDQASMIRAFRVVRERRPEAVLVLIGDGELRAGLEQLAATEGVADGVRFLGDRSDVHQLLQGLDLFVLSSVSEGYSMALLEASATALPIVATDVGGNREIVHDGLTGALVQAGDVAALAAAILAILDDPERARVLGGAAREWVEANGSLDHMAARYERLYDAVAG